MFQQAKVFSNVYYYGLDNGMTLDEHNIIDDENLAEAVANKLVDTFQNHDYGYFVVSAAHVYNRKGYISTDQLGGARNRSYASETDDVVIQMSVRLPYKEAEEIIESAKTSKNAALKAKLEIEKADLEAQKAVIEARLSEIS